MPSRVHWSIVITVLGRHSNHVNYCGRQVKYNTTFTDRVSIKCVLYLEFCSWLVRPLSLSTANHEQSEIFQMVWWHTKFLQITGLTMTIYMALLSCQPWNPRQVIKRLKNGTFCTAYKFGIRITITHFGCNTSSAILGVFTVWLRGAWDEYLKWTVRGHVFIRTLNLCIGCIIDAIYNIIIVYNLTGSIVLTLLATSKYFWGTLFKPFNTVRLTGWFSSDCLMALHKQIWTSK